MWEHGELRTDENRELDFKIQVYISNRIRRVRQGMESDEEKILQRIRYEVNQQAEVNFL